MLETDIVLNGGGVIAPSSLLLEGPTNTKKVPKIVGDRHRPRRYRQPA